MAVAPGTTVIPSPARHPRACGEPVNAAMRATLRQRRVLGRPVEPGDDSGERDDMCKRGASAQRSNFRSTISNSQASAFSRRHASEVCPYPSRKVREGDGAAGGARVLARHPLRRGYPPTSRGTVRPRAPSDVGRCASRRSTFSHQSIGPGADQTTRCDDRDIILG